MLNDVGFQQVYEAWGTAEMGLMATEVDGIDHPNRVLMPLLNHHSIEIYPIEAAPDSRQQSKEPENHGKALLDGPESLDDLEDIRDINTQKIGRAYPSREGLERYDQRDAIQVIPGKELPEEWPNEIPGIRVLGRLDGLTIGGPTVTEEDIENVVQSLSDPAQDPEYHFSKVGDPTTPSMIIKSEMDVESDMAQNKDSDLRKALQMYIPEVVDAYDNGFIDSIKYQQNYIHELIRGDGAKVQRFSDHTVP
jgi:hypothetical protein